MGDIQSRLKSKVVWVSITTAVLTIAGEIGLYEKIGIERQSIQTIIDVILLTCTSLGIFNNPTSKTSF
jgi:uncharacterized membrane protein